MGVDLGFKTDRVVTFTISPEMNGYSFDACRALLARAESELAAIPGVTAATDAMVGLIEGDIWGNTLTIPGLKLPNMNAKVNEVGPGFFADMGIPLMAGREFTESDNLAGRTRRRGQSRVRQSLLQRPQRAGAAVPRRRVTR